MVLYDLMETLKLFGLTQFFKSVLADDNKTLNPNS